MKRYILNASQTRALHRLLDNSGSVALDIYEPDATGAVIVAVWYGGDATLHRIFPDGVVGEPQEVSRS